MLNAHLKVFSFIFQFFFLLSVCSEYSFSSEYFRPDPERSFDKQIKKTAQGQDFMIVTANPYATHAGYEILKRGGSAADAAITAQLVLGLVEPQSSGLGGGAFILYYDATEKKLKSYDAREIAPFLSGPFLFSENGQKMDFQKALLGGRAVGVPGVPMLLSNLHEAHGQLTWMELFEEPVKLAKNGFIISERLHNSLKAHTYQFANLAHSRALNHFFNVHHLRVPEDEEGPVLHFEPVAVGTMFKNPDYAKTLLDFSFYGSGVFYQGKIADHIVEAVQNIENNPGLLTLRDFQEYEIKVRDPVCGPYRAYIVCSMGEPSSGGLTLLQILGMLEHYDLPEWGSEDPRSWHVIVEASRLAFADRNLYMADPDFVNTPGVALLDPVYLKAKSDLINAGAVLKDVEAGKPPLWQGPLFEKGLNIDFPGTSHISVVDSYGNVLSMTTSIESAFGSHIMVDGFLLNNQLTDFSFLPMSKDGALVANMPEPGKRPRSSMTPTIVFDMTGKPVLVLGSAGGSSIIGYVLQRIIGVLDWGIEIQEAMNMPNILSRGAEIEMEEEHEALRQGLKKLGHMISIKDKNSGLTGIHIKGGYMYGAADPRREGLGQGQ